MGERSGALAADGRSTFLAFYDDALPHVFGYLSSRCEQPAVAEDLTAETFLAAVDAFRAGGGVASGPFPPCHRGAAGAGPHRLPPILRVWGGG